MNSGSRFTDRLNSIIDSKAGTLRASLLASILAVSMGMAVAQDNQQSTSQPETQQIETSQSSPDQTSTEMGAAGDETVIQIGSDQTISESEFEQEFQRAVRVLAAQQGLPYNEETQALFDRFRSDFLDQFATQQALLQEAQARGITVDEAQVEQQITKAQESFGGEQAFQQALQEFGYDSVDAYRQTVREGLIAQQVADEFRADIQLTDEEVQTFFEQNRETFGDVSLEQVREQVEAQLTNERLTERFSELRTQYDIQTFPEAVAVESVEEGVAGGGQAGDPDAAQEDSGRNNGTPDADSQTDQEQNRREGESDQDEYEGQ